MHLPPRRIITSDSGSDNIVQFLHTELSWFLKGSLKEPSPTEEPLFSLSHLYRFSEELFKEMVP